MEVLVMEVLAMVIMVMVIMVMVILMVFTVVVVMAMVVVVIVVLVMVVVVMVTMVMVEMVTVVTVTEGGLTDGLAGKAAGVQLVAILTLTLVASHLVHTDLATCVRTQTLIYICGQRSRVSRETGTHRMNTGHTIS